MDISYGDYWAEIKSIAEDVIAECEEYGQDLYDYTHEVVDGHQWIIYNAYNDDVIKHSGNPDAWEDCYSNEDIGRLVTDGGMDNARAGQAYFAMQQDVSEEINKQLENRRFTQKKLGIEEW